MVKFLLGLVVAYILSMCVAAGYYYGHKRGYDRAIQDVQTYFESMEEEPVEPSVAV